MHQNSHRVAAAIRKEGTNSWRHCRRRPAGPLPQPGPGGGNCVVLPTGWAKERHLGLPCALINRWSGGEALAAPCTTLPLPLSCCSGVQAPETVPLVAPGLFHNQQEQGRQQEQQQREEDCHAAQPDGCDVQKRRMAGTYGCPRQQRRIAVLTCAHVPALVLTPGAAALVHTATMERR